MDRLDSNSILSFAAAIVLPILLKILTLFVVGCHCESWSQGSINVGFFIVKVHVPNSVLNLFTVWKCLEVLIMLIFCNTGLENTAKCKFTHTSTDAPGTGYLNPLSQTAG